MVLFLEIKVKQEPCGSVHVAAQLHQLRIRVPGGNRSEGHPEGFKILFTWAFFLVLVFASTPWCHIFTVSKRDSSAKDASLAAWVDFSLPTPRFFVSKAASVL
jgi:hypothetical protein